MGNNDKFHTQNDIKVHITDTKGESLLTEDCCTCINILLKNNGELATSFLGSHNPYIVDLLEKAQKAYFKQLKKTLLKEYKSKTTPYHECDDECCECDECRDDDCDCDDECDDECDCDDCCDDDCDCCEDGYDCDCGDDDDMLGGDDEDCRIFKDYECQNEHCTCKTRTDKKNGGKPKKLTRNKKGFMHDPDVCKCGDDCTCTPNNNCGCIDAPPVKKKKIDK